LVQKYEDAKEFDLLVNVVWVGVGGFCHELDGVGVAVHSDEYDSHRFCKVDGVGMELKTFFEDAFGIIEISELAKGAGEIDGKVLGSRRIAKEHDGLRVLLPSQECSTQAFERGL
jgi:hypothetical protein